MNFGRKMALQNQISHIFAIWSNQKTTCRSNRHLDSSFRSQTTLFQQEQPFGVTCSVCLYTSHIFHIHTHKIKKRKKRKSRTQKHTSPNREISHASGTFFPLLNFFSRSHCWWICCCEIRVSEYGKRMYFHGWRVCAVELIVEMDFWIQHNLRCRNRCCFLCECEYVLVLFICWVVRFSHFVFFFFLALILC